MMLVCCFSRGHHRVPGYELRYGGEEGMDWVVEITLMQLEECRAVDLTPSPAELSPMTFRLWLKLDKGSGTTTEVALELQLEVDLEFVESERLP